MLLSRLSLVRHPNSQRPYPVTAVVDFIRCLSSGEVSTALRPFYFSVHPDLFGQHPNERTVNENSLKQLSSYLETIQQRRAALPTTIKFYLRSQQPSSKAFQMVTISLQDHNIRNTVLSILKTCNLPTTYVDNIRQSPDSLSKSIYSTAKRNNFKTKYDPIFKDSEQSYGAHVMRSAIRKAKEAEKLKPWLEKNVIIAAEKQAACLPIQEEIRRLRKALIESIKLNDIIWDCGWNITHFRGCLQSFHALVRDHPELLTVLKGKLNEVGRFLEKLVASVINQMDDIISTSLQCQHFDPLSITVVFGNCSGVSWRGNVLLSSSEVRHDWHDFLKNLWQQDAALVVIPAMQKAVSRVLRDIKVVHRKFQPNVVARNYANQLRRLVTSLSDHQGRHGYPRSWPMNLQKFELVVEPEAGPLMLSPTGQFIVPSSCPASLLVGFLSEHMTEAEELLNNYQMNKHVERDLHEQCKAELGLHTLNKEDNVTPDLMILCCTKLLEHKSDLSSLLHGRCLWITNYYSVMSDGQLCIPWNWKL